MVNEIETIFHHWVILSVAEEQNGLFKMEMGYQFSLRGSFSH